jgi:nucleoid DNA-binding protein
MSANKFTRADIAKTITEAGIERVNAAGLALALAIVKSMADALIAGKVIELRGFGTLEQRTRKGRTMHNPLTMAVIDVPDRRGVFFRPCGQLKRAINKEKL